MGLQDQTVKPTVGAAQLEIADSASGKCCGNDLVGEERFEIDCQIAESAIALILIEDALTRAKALPPLSDRESLFLVWERNASQAVKILNDNARSENEKWTIHRLTKAMHDNFGCKWPARNQQQPGYKEFCQKHHIEIPETKIVKPRKRHLMCTVQGCETLALRQNGGKFCGGCLEMEMKQQSKQSAKKSCSILPVAISATASTRQQESNGLFYCVVQKLLEIHVLQHLICNIFFHTQV